MTPQTMLAELKAKRPKDWPRFCVIHAAYDLPGGEVYLGGDLDNAAEVNRRTDRGSLNQGGGYLSELYHLRPRHQPVRRKVISRLRHQVEVELLEGEFGSTGYPGHNRGWILAIYLVAQRIGDAEVAALALRVMQAVVSIEHHLEAPPDAHPTLRGHSFMPGSRSADRRGVSKERDECRRMEMAGEPVGRAPKQNHQNIEVWMVRNAVAAGLLPAIKLGPLAPIRWAMLVRRFAHGMEVSFPGGMPRSIASVYGLSIDWRKELRPDGVRGGAVEWVAWDEFAAAYKGSRPEGWDYPGGPMPRPLPERDLGALLSEEWIPSGNEPSRPPERPEPPAPPPPPERPAPPPPPPENQPPIPASGRHVTFRGDGADIIVNILPGGKWEGRRFRLDGGDWQTFR